MGAIRMLASSDLRRRWGGALLLTVLVGLVGAVVLASVAGARRTSSSLGRFERESLAADLEIDAGEATPAQLREFSRTQGVETVAALRQLVLFPEHGYAVPTAGPLDDAFGNTVDRARVISGRRARGVHELTIGEGLAEPLGIEVGDTLRFVSLSPEQLLGELEEFPEPKGPTMTFRVVGIVRRPLDLGSRGAAGGVIVPTRAFTERYADRIGSWTGTVLRVRTAHGAKDLPQVVVAARRIFGGNDVFGVQTIAIEGEGVQSAIDVTTVGLWLLAAVAAAAGLVAIGISLSRHMALAELNKDALRALGLRWRQRWAAAVAGVLPVAVAGAVVAVVGAVLASPLFPLGVAGDAEPDPGIDVDTLTLALGAAGATAAVLAVAAIAAVVATARVDRDRSRPAMPTATATRAGLPTTVSTGIGFALERGSGQGGIPVWSSLAGASFAVLGIVAALLFGSSLDRLVTVPSSYGWTWDYVAYDNRVQGDELCGSRKAFSRDQMVSAVTLVCVGDVEIDGRPTTAYSFEHVRGDIVPTVVEGRAPRTSGELALGRATLEAAGKEIGDVVTATGSEGERKFRVVGTTVFPPIPGSDPEPLADGGAFTKPGFVSLGAGSNDFALVNIAPGIDRVRALKHLRALAGDFDSALPPIVPAEIERLRQIDRLPMLLAGFIAAVALLAVGYALVTAVRRRRQDLAILKTLGYRRRQVRAAVAWHATTVGLIGLVVGVPLGIVAGRLVWELIADDVGVSSSVAVPTLALLAVVFGVLLVVNVAAAVPARTAAATRPATVLRSE